MMEIGLTGCVSVREIMIKLTFATDFIMRESIKSNPCVRARACGNSIEIVRHLNMYIKSNGISICPYLFYSLHWKAHSSTRHSSELCSVLFIHFYSIRCNIKKLHISKFPACICLFPFGWKWVLSQSVQFFYGHFRNVSMHEKCGFQNLHVPMLTQTNRYYVLGCILCAYTFSQHFGISVIIANGYHHSSDGWFFVLKIVHHIIHMWSENYAREFIWHIEL